MHKETQHISPLQYITQPNDELNELKQIELFAQLGVDWIQLRLKNIQPEEYLSIAKDAVSIAHEYDCKLIINDNLNVALTSDADGVHLGLGDLPTQRAREVAPEDFIIGGTANTLEDVLYHLPWADYVGVGPYKFTSTKDNLSPILGLEGYQDLMEELNRKKSIPVIAIGGIELLDIPFIADTGVNGVAISSALLNQKGNATQIKQIIATVNAAWKN